MEILRLKYDICNILLQLNLHTDRQVRPGLADNAGVWRGGGRAHAEAVGASRGEDYCWQSE
ncbi:hypothetical protein EMIT0P201_10082 [Pseudomonas chlororaphis]